MRVPFNKPYMTGKETGYIKKAVEMGHISGNGPYTKKCQAFFEQKYGFNKCLLTTSCTDALEMTALLTGIQPGDEVIMPSYTFVSTANAFALRGAKIVFADSQAHHPNIDPLQIKKLITPRTKAIVVVHYAGVACDMDQIMELANEHGIFVIEDAAQAIDSYYNNRPLGSIGHFGTFSFHETKNIISGEGGMLVVNDDQYSTKAEIIWEKGTNRAAFYRGEVNKYGWVDIGSSFLPSEVIAAFLFAQLECLENIQERRLSVWNRYYNNLLPLQGKGLVKLPVIEDFSTNNAHCFYIVLENIESRDSLIQHLKEKGFHSVFHYLPLHQSPYFTSMHDSPRLPNAQRYADCLLRLPLFYELDDSDVEEICKEVFRFFH